jgi:hypothetical protein
MKNKLLYEKQKEYLMGMGGKSMYKTLKMRLKHVLKGFFYMRQSQFYHELVMFEQIYHCLKIFTDFSLKIHNKFIQFICMRKMISGAYEPLKKLVKINK